MSQTPVRRRVTLATIAAEAGVSLSTISKVLNGRPDVSPATRAHVEMQLAAHGYHRRRQSVASNPLLEVVVHELEAGFLVEIMRGIEDVARDMGLGVVISETGTRFAPGPEWVSGVIQRRPRGVILLFSDLDEEARSLLLAREIPFVVIDPAGEPQGDTPSVGAANWAGGLMATRHLIELGHTRIGVVAGPADVLCARARVDGFRSAMSVAGIEVDESLILWSDFTVEGGRESGVALLNRRDRPTAIFAGNDLQALGLYDVARSHGLSIPEDLSVVGFDDIPMASWFSPQLTTVHQPLRQMGDTAARLVLRAAADKLDGLPQLDLATSLVVRESTAPPRG